MKRLFTLFLVLIASSCFAQTKIGENIDVSHYEIRINEFNFTAHTIDAVTTVTLTAKSTLSSFALELKSLEVSSVVSSDAMVSGFNKNGEVLTITLASPLAEGASASFVISYSGNTFNDGWGGVLWNSSGYVCNMGVGMLFIVSEKDADRVIDIIDECGERPVPLGLIEKPSKEIRYI